MPSFLRMAGRFGLVGLILALSAPTAPALTLVRHPYIQNTSQTGVTVVWTTDQTGDSVVEYGLTPKLGLVATGPSGTNRHAVRLADLLPDTYYYYQVRTNGEVLSGLEYFKTANGPDNPFFTVAILGDSGDGLLAQRFVAFQMASIAPNLILHTGDVVYPDGADFWYNWAYFDIYRDIIKNTPVFPSLGNHDYETNRGAPYLANFYLPENAGRPEHNERYYSFNYGGAHFIALDTELVPGGVANPDQMAWLEADLAAHNDALWKFIYFHRPPFSSGRHGSSESVRNVVAPLAEKYNVDFVFSGHDHSYERTRPILNNQPAGNGVLYVVTGGGGVPLYSVGRSAWTAFSGSFHHTTKLTVSNLTLTLEAVDALGPIRDTFTWSKGLLFSFITDSSGQPLPAATAKVLIGPRPRAQRPAGADGTALFYLADGSYTLEVSAPGCQTRTVEGLVVQGEALTLAEAVLDCP